MPINDCVLSCLCIIYSLNFQNPSVPPATNSRLSPLPHEPADYDHAATVDIPLDNSKVKQIVNFHVCTVFDA